MFSFSKVTFLAVVVCIAGVLPTQESAAQVNLHNCLGSDPAQSSLTTAVR